MITKLWNDHLVGSPLERALLVRRRSPIWLRAGILFIHVPKAAGTSLSEVLYGRFLGHVRAADVRRWGSRTVNALPTIAVTRNPWDRLVSAYRFATRGGGIGGAQAGGVWRPERYRTPEFDSFERFVREWLEPRDRRKLDYVFQPQSLFVCDEHGQVLVDHVGRYDDLDATRSFLEEAVPGLPSIPQSNRSGAPVDYRTFYTPELAKLVGDIYADDVRLFGYRFGQ
jgi:hypothetical protein